MMIFLRFKKWIYNILRHARKHSKSMPLQIENTHSDICVRECYGNDGNKSIDWQYSVKTLLLVLAFYSECKCILCATQVVFNDFFERIYNIIIVYLYRYIFANIAIILLYQTSDGFQLSKIYDFC